MTDPMRIKHLKDEELLLKTEDLVRKHKKLTVKVFRCLRELERRQAQGLKDLPNEGKVKHLDVSLEVLEQLPAASDWLN